MINLGDKVKDKITGFEGIAVAKINYLNGCIRYKVKPNRLIDGKTIEGEWIDIQQLEVMEANMLLKTKPTGGPGSVPRVKMPKF